MLQEPGNVPNTTGFVRMLCKPVPARVTPATPAKYHRSAADTAVTCFLYILATLNLLCFGMHIWVAKQRAYFMKNPQVVPES